jgi:hypothetical protein
MLDRRGRQLPVAISFVDIRPAPSDAALGALRSWLDSWAGIGAVTAGIAHQLAVSLAYDPARGATGFGHIIVAASPPRCRRTVVTIMGVARQVDRMKDR